MALTPAKALGGKYARLVLLMIRVLLSQQELRKCLRKAFKDKVILEEDLSSKIVLTANSKTLFTPNSKQNQVRTSSLRAIEKSNSTERN